MQFAFVNFVFYLFFVFIQVFDDTFEGHNVCADYRLDSIPAVLIIDPITGKKMCSWDGMVEPQSLLEVCDM
jgi:UBX domain-containing protein 7